MISVTRLLGTGVREREDRIEESCADAHGEKAAQSAKDIAGETMRDVRSGNGMNGRHSMPASAQVMRTLVRR